MPIQLPYTGVTTTETIPAPYTNSGAVDISTKEDKANKGIANGYAPLDGTTLLPTANLPSHTHTIANVTGLQAALSGKQASGNYAPSTGISPSAITGTAVVTNDSRLSDSRTPTAHTHASSEITGLPNVNTSTLDGTGGFIDLHGGTDTEWSTAGNAGSIDLSGGDGSTTEEDANQNGGNGGSLLLSGESLSGADGGTIDCRGLNGNPGGSINTSDGGGSINTRGVGSIGLGGDSTRTILVGSANGGNKTITLPNATGTIALTSDSRFTDSRTPTAHTHGNITNSGAVGSTANLPLITTTSGVVTTGTFGTTVNSFCAGDDSRLSNSRTPTSHSHSISEVTSLQATLIAFAIALG